MAYKLSKEVVERDTIYRFDKDLTNKVSQAMNAICKPFAGIAITDRFTLFGSPKYWAVCDRLNKMRYIPLERNNGTPHSIALCIAEYAHN